MFQADYLILNNLLGNSYWGSWFFLSYQLLTVYSSSLRSVIRFTPSTLACQLVLSLVRSYWGKDIVEISLAQCPCHMQKALSARDISEGVIISMPLSLTWNRTGSPIRAPSLARHFSLRTQKEYHFLLSQPSGLLLLLSWVAYIRHYTRAPCLSPNFSGLGLTSLFLFI